MIEDHYYSVFLLQVVGANVLYGINNFLTLNITSKNFFCFNKDKDNFFINQIFFFIFFKNLFIYTNIRYKKLITKLFFSIFNRKFISTFFTTSFFITISKNCITNFTSFFILKNFVII